MALLPGTRIGVYEVTASLGAGGMGEVYRAKDSRLKREVALKVLPADVANDRERMARFQREAEVLASLNHPNIAQIYGLEDGALVMELVEGEDLAERLRRGLIPLDEALPIAKQIADALEAAHEQGIIHRDLKPANIKVRPDGTVKVLDFGLAKALDEPKGSSPLDLENSPTITSPAMTMRGMILGTAAYMAPEQARGRAIDRRADIWAFGVVLYEMLTGRRAFEGDDISITIANVLKEELQWSALPAGVPPSVQRLLRRCLEKDPKRRLSSIGDARLELDESEAAPIVTPPVRHRRNLVPWAVAAVATIGAAVVGLIAFGGAREPVTPVWTSIPAPVSTFSRGLGPAVSPDGRHIAFVAPDDSGSESLWTRALTAQSAQMIEGTSGANLPFWSPDSRSVAFFKDGKLLTVPAVGGATMVVADAPNPRGGTWNQDGVILFVPGSGLGLHRVSASGAASAVPLEVPADQSTTAISWPSFLPDGQHFLFTGIRDAQMWIHIGSLTDPDHTPLLQAASKAHYADGYLLFGSKGGLYAQPFDAASLALSGERVRIVDEIGASVGSTNNHSFSASATRSVIAVGHRPFVREAQLTWFDRNGARLGVLGEAGRIFGLSASPDRTRIVIERNDSRQNSVDPWIVQIDSGFAAPVRAMAEGALASSPVWSHDSRKVFYSSGYGAMLMASLSGETDERWPVGIHWPTSSSPDGRLVMIQQELVATQGDLMIVSLTGDHTPAPYLQTPFNEHSGRFSPDGRSVAYVSNESGRDEVYVQSFPRTAAKIRISAAGGTHPEWNDDGREVYFLQAQPSGQRSMMVASMLVGRSSPPRRLFDLPPGVWEDSGRSMYAVFDDGRRFLVNVLVPIAAPQVLTFGQNWTAALNAAK